MIVYLVEGCHYDRSYDDMMPIKPRIFLCKDEAFNFILNENEIDAETHYNITPVEVE